MLITKKLLITIISLYKINTIIEGETTLIIEKTNTMNYKLNILNSKEQFQKKLITENEYLNFGEYYGKNYDDANMVIFKFFKETKEISVNLKSTCYLPFLCVRYSKLPLIDLKADSSLFLNCDIVGLNLIDKTLPDQTINYVLKKSDTSSSLKLSFSAVERYLEGFVLVSCLLYPDNQSPILTFSLKYERFLVDTEEIIIFDENDDSNFKNIIQNLLIKKSGSHKMILKNLFKETIVNFQINDYLKFLSISFEYITGGLEIIENYEILRKKKFVDIKEITIFIKNNYFKDIQINIKISSFDNNDINNNIFLNSQIVFILILTILSFFLVLIVIYQFKIMFSNRIDNKIEPQILQIVSQVSNNSFNQIDEDDEDLPIPIFSVKLKKYKNKF